MSHYPDIIEQTGSGSRLIYGFEKVEEKSERPIILLDQYCLNHGSSLEGRQSSFRFVTSSFQKPAVMVDEISRTIYFPTLGNHNPECVWICYNTIVRSQSVNDSQSALIFEDGLKYIANVNVRTIRLQMKRCEQYLHKMNSLESDTF